MVLCSQLLNCLGKPNITNVDSEYYGVTGDKVLKIPCDVTGVPEPTITWKHGNKVVTAGIVLIHIIISLLCFTDEVSLIV